jgi:hypothetical protein
MKDEIKDLVQGGEQMLFNAILVSLSSIVAIIALVTILIIK